MTVTKTLKTKQTELHSSLGYCFLGFQEVCTFLRSIEGRTLTTIFFSYFFSKTKLTKIAKAKIYLSNLSALLYHTLRLVSSSRTRHFELGLAQTSLSSLNCHRGVNVDCWKGGAPGSTVGGKQARFV